jgi:hypothetical protein
MKETREQQIKRWDDAGIINSARIDELLGEINDNITKLGGMDLTGKPLDEAFSKIDDMIAGIGGKKPAQRVPSFITQSTFIK